MFNFSKAAFCSFLFYINFILTMSSSTFSLELQILTVKVSSSMKQKIIAPPHRLGIKGMWQLVSCTCMVSVILLSNAWKSLPLTQSVIKSLLWYTCARAFVCVLGEKITMSDNRSNLSNLGVLKKNLLPNCFFKYKLHESY